jgi:hypothetical protein
MLNNDVKTKEMLLYFGGQLLAEQSEQVNDTAINGRIIVRVSILDRLEF